MCVGAQKHHFDGSGYHETGGAERQTDCAKANNLVEIRGNPITVILMSEAYISCDARQGRHDSRKEQTQRGHRDLQPRPVGVGKSFEQSLLVSPRIVSINISPRL